MSILINKYQLYYYKRFNHKINNNNNDTIIIVAVSVPIQITIGDNGALPMVNRSYTLTCYVNVMTVTTYTWKKNNELLPNEQESTLMFPSLNLSNAGEYTCEVNVLSRIYRANKTISLCVTGK